MSSNEFLPIGLIEHLTQDEKDHQERIKQFEFPEGAKYVYGSFNATCPSRCIMCGSPKLHDGPYIECSICTNNREYVFGKCYNCDRCIADRKYIEETSNIFKFIGFIQVDSSTHAQAWKCSGCNNCIAIQHLYPSMSRDIIWVKARKMHLEPAQGYSLSVCEMFRTGQLSH